MGFLSSSASLAFFLALCWLIHQKQASRLAVIPDGHSSSRFATFWIWWIRYTGQEDEVVAALHHRLGPIIRLSPFEISVVGEAISNIDHLKCSAHCTQSIKQSQSQLSTVHESDGHQARCRLLYPVLRGAFQKRWIRALLDEVYIPIFESTATNNLVCDAKNVNTAMISRIITCLASSDQGYNLRDSMMIGKFSRFFRLGSLHSSSQQRSVNLVSNPPRLSRGPLANRGIYDQVNSDILDLGVAEHAAVGQTLTLAMQRLSEHKDLQEYLHKEFRDNRTSASKMPASRQQLDLCHNVVIETLRLRGRGPLPRVGPPPWGAENINLPAWTQVSIPLYVSHRNPRVFANPTQWDPMRWVDTSAEVAGSAQDEGKKERCQSDSLPGSGICVEDDLAMYTLRYALRAVYSRFESENVEGGIRFYPVRDSDVAQNLAS